MNDIGITYREIKDIVNNMTEEQLDQIAQIMLPHPDGNSIPLHLAIGLNTVHYYVTDTENNEEELTRSPIDNNHHSNQYVFLVDWNMFAEDGTMGFDLETGKRF